MHACSLEDKITIDLFLSSLSGKKSGKIWAINFGHSYWPEKYDWYFEGKATIVWLTLCWS